MFFFLILLLLVLPVACYTTSRAMSILTCIVVVICLYLFNFIKYFIVWRIACAFTGDFYKNTLHRSRMANARLAAATHIPIKRLTTARYIFLYIGCYIRYLDAPDTTFTGYNSDVLWYWTCFVISTLITFTVFFLIDWVIYGRWV